MHFDQTLHCATSPIPAYRLPTAPNIFTFVLLLGKKIAKIIVWRPNLCSGGPPLGNPGSATEARAFMRLTCFSQTALPRRNSWIPEYSKNKEHKIIEVLVNFKLGMLKFFSMKIFTSAHTLPYVFEKKFFINKRTCSWSHCAIKIISYKNKHTITLYYC